MKKKKIAVFVEGKTEFILFIRLIQLSFDYGELSYEGFELIGETLRPTSYKYRNQNSNYDFLVINAGNDERIIVQLFSQFLS